MPEVIHLLPLAFGLGLLHALDADHVLAVSAATSNTDRPGTIKFCLNWALGHGLTVSMVSILVFVFDNAIPVGMSHAAEAGVGILLFILGLWILSQRHPAHKNTEHAGLVNMGDRSAPLVGVLHGLAGSAPFLLILPLGLLSTMQALLYVLLFCLGVLLAMVLFGQLLNGLWKNLSTSDRCEKFRFGIAIVSMTMGIYMFSVTVGSM